MYEQTKTGCSLYLLNLSKDVCLFLCWLDKAIKKIWYFQAEQFIQTGYGLKLSKLTVGLEKSLIKLVCFVLEIYLKV